MQFLKDGVQTVVILRNGSNHMFSHDTHIYGTKILLFTIKKFSKYSHENAAQNSKSNLLYGPLHKKMNNMHKRKQRCISAVQAVFVFATQIVQFLFLNPKFQAYNLLL